MSRTNYALGKVFQAFEASDGAIFRLQVSNNPKLNLDELSVVDDMGASVLKRAVFLDDERDSEVRWVSLLLPVSCHAFKVMRNGKTIASLSKLEYHELIFSRDFRMVNPAIDGRYREWVETHPTGGGIDQSSFAIRPLFSVIVPLFNTPLPYLKDMLDSVLAQTYAKWELILVNASPANQGMLDVLKSYEDSRIKTVVVEKNLGIAGNTNIGIKHAAGDYIAFFDHDDVLDKNALLEYANAVNECSDVDLLYCDEDNFEEDVAKSHSPLFKPDLNLDLLYSHNYVVHMLTVSRRVIQAVELSPDYVSGAQDYDLTLKAWEVARAVRHIPSILYHWRIHSGSTNGGVMDSKPYAIEAGRRALEDHFQRRGVRCNVSASSYINCVYDISYEGFDPSDVTLLVPYSNEDKLRGLVASLDVHDEENLNARLSILAIGPQPRESIPGVSTIAWAKPFDLSEMLRKALPSIGTSKIIVCDENARFDGLECVKQLAAALQRSEVGISSAKLLYNDGLVQHAGMALTSDQRLAHINQNFSARMGGGYLGLAECSCNYSCVAPSCFCARREDLTATLTEMPRQTSPLDLMAHLAARLRARGKPLVVLPQATATIFAAPQRLGVKSAAPYAELAPEVLRNPAVTYDEGYPQLNVPKDEQKELRSHLARIALRKIRRR